MFSSIVKAGMKAITPRGKMNEEDNNNKPLTRANLPTTPKNYSQASIATPSTAATVDITANTTFESIAVQQPKEVEKDTVIQNKKEQKSDSNPKSSTNTKNATTETTTTTSIPALWQVLDTQLRSNIGTSVRCGICLSTVSDPVRTPCSHGFCRSCITSYLRHQHSGTNSCPECKAPCTRRGLETFSDLDEMADSYKAMLRAFGLAPGMYTPEITTMTQKVVDTTGGEDCGCNFDDQDLDEAEAREARFDRLCVSAAYKQALPELFETKACSKMQMEENEQVVNANFEACFGEDVDEEELEAMDALFKSCLKAKHPIPLSSQAMPNTQDVNEQAREQLEADREMQESMENEHDDDEVNNNETDPSPNDDDDEDDFFTLRKQKSVISNNKKDPFELPEEPRASPPIFARADSGTKNNRHTFKSFSKRDSSEGRPSFPLSPIDHEKSFETSRLSTNSESKLHVTGMLEDSRGGLHMMAMSGVQQDNDGNNSNSDFDDDKTIAFTMDDSPAFSRASEGDKDESNKNNESNDNDNDNKDGQSPDSNSCSSNDDPDSNEYQLPLTYDPIGHPTEITEEYHTSTKTEISNAANMPAGREVGDQKLKTKKALFPESEKKQQQQQTATRKSSRRKALKEQEDILSNLDGHPNEKEENSHPNVQEEESAALEYPLGTIVRVQARTWPGVNKQGGVGRITGYNSDGTYNVAYVLGGKESKIDAVFVSREGEIDDSTDDASSAASKRRRRVKDMLPEELLKQLAEEGFDVPGVKAKPKKKAKASSALSDSTNQRGSKRKRTTSRVSSDSKEAQITQRARRKQLPPLAETKSSTSRRRKQARKPEDAHLPTTVKKVKEAPSTKKKAARKTVTWSTEASTRTRKKKPPPMVVNVDTSFIDSQHEQDFSIADAMYKERIETAIQNKSLVAVTSNLSEAEHALFSSLLSNQVLKAGHSVDETTQICIVPALGNETNQQSIASVRTLKVMLSALRGIPLVTPDWIKTCFLEKQMVVPQRFLRSIPTKDSVLQASGDALCGVTKLAVNQEIPLFQNVFACLCGGYEGKTKGSMKELLEAGGATILSTSQEVEQKLQEITTNNNNSNGERIVVVCGNSSRGSSSRKSGIKLATPATRGLRDLLKQRQEQPLEQEQPSPAIVVDSQWVIESVTCAKAMPPNLFEPCIHKDLWKLCL